MILLLILIIETAITYDFKCPSEAEWRLRAKVSCLTENKYVCLFHLLEQKYQDNCLGPKRSSIGSNLVFQPLFNIAECSAGRYQPFVFTTNRNSECIILKSKCDEEGQVVYSNGTSDHDAVCRCDYTQGYSFVSKPKNSCFCKPSEEDCSCLRINCTKLSSDYQCISDGETIGNTTCQEIHSQITYTRYERTVQDINSNIKRYSYVQHLTYIIIILMAVHICIAMIAVISIKVFVPPKILKQQIITGVSGKIGVRLECFVRSYLPLRSIIWCTELGEQIHDEQNIDAFYGSEGTWTLTFETRGEYDHGTFKCVIRNAAGTVESEPVLLYGKFCDVQPTILEQKTIPSDSAKLNIGLECSVMSYLPLKSVKWYRQVEERLQVERIIDVDLIGEGPWTFTFETPKKHDHGTFKCVASNEVGTVESEPVLLFCKLNDVPPKILEQKAILSDSAKLNIGLECSVMSYLPLKSVKWCRQVEEQLQIERIIEVVFKGEGPWTFTYETPGENDHGTIKCVASNDVGTVESEPVLIYGKLCDVPPEIIEQKTITTSDSDEKAIGLKCYVKSYLPLTSVKWCTQLEEQIHDEPDIDDVFSRDRTWTFTFKTPEEYKNDTFKCVVSNKVGTIESEPVLLYGKVYFDQEKQKDMHELLLTGQCGKHHFARVVFIGKNNVGKTSLMRRLLGQNKDDVINTESTDGIEIEKCNINVANGTWSKCDKTDNDLSRLIQQVFTEKKQNTTEALGKTFSVQSSSETSSCSSIIDEDETSSQISSDECSTEYENDAKTDSSNDSFESHDSFATDSKRENINTTTYATRDNVEYIEDNEKQIDESENENENEEVMGNVENINKMTSKIMESCLHQNGDAPHDQLAFCWLWDFAGQKDYYATHQVFLSTCAVYLLVTDSLEFSTAKMLWTNIEDSAQYVNFWFDTIHCYWSTTKSKRLDPPIIVVCTNQDKLTDLSERKKRQEQFEEYLGRALNKQEKKNHMRNIFFVSNTEDTDSVFEVIRRCISRQAMDMNDWGIDCPLKWLLFQQVLGTLKTNNIHISTTKTLLEIAKHEDIGINQDEEVKRCLQYCHNIGTIIYFNEEHLQRYVILDPKWLVNAFRCLVSDKIEDMVRVSDDWQTLRETGELTDLLISRLFRKEPTLRFFENKRHLIEVMKRFDIIVSLRNSVALYMPCMMKSYSFEEFGKQFVDGKKYYFRTSWLCLEFEFLPPAFFNHILAWYIKQYDVSIIFDRGTRKERKALYRQIGVFNLDSSGCEQLVICEGPNIIALQVWNSQRSDQTYGYLKSSLVHFVVELGDHYKLRIKFTITFKCNEGDFTIHRKKMKDLLFKYYHCQEHETDHSSGDLVIPWEMNEELEIMLTEEFDNYGQLCDGKHQRSAYYNLHLDMIGKSDSGDI